MRPPIVRVLEAIESNLAEGFYPECMQDLQALVFYCLQSNVSLEFLDRVRDVAKRAVALRAESGGDA
jgi:hypothetical protein